MCRGTNRISSRRHLALIAGAVSILVAPWCGAVEDQAPKEPEKQTGSADRPPPWQRVLKGEGARRVEALEKQIADLERKGQFAEAVVPATKALEIRQSVQGEDHFESVIARLRKQTDERAAGLPREVQTDLASAIRASLTAQELFNKGQYGEVQPLLERALAIRRRALGEDHPDTAESYHNVAINLDALGRYGEAQPRYERALEIRRKALGDDNPLTAISYDGAAGNLFARARHGDAQPLYERALAIRRAALGEDHPDTAESYHNLAFNLHSMGRYDEAQLLYERALAIRRAALGEDNPKTAQTYNNLAFNLFELGRYGEAQPLYVRALEMRR